MIPLKSINWPARRMKSQTIGRSSCNSEFGVLIMRSAAFAGAWSRVARGHHSGAVGGLWWKYRGQRVVTCPENQRPAGVSRGRGPCGTQRPRFPARVAVEPMLPMAGTGRVRAGMPAPDRSSHRGLPGPQHPLELVRGQKLPVLRHGPSDRLSWEGRSRRCFPPIRSVTVSVEWSDIPAEQLQEVLSAAEPVCFACHMASKMMREHPELVIDRSAGTVHPSR